MSITRHLSTKRLAVLAAVVLGLGLLAGCSDEPPSGLNGGSSAQASSAAISAANQREAVFSVPGMECPMCPVTVKRALSNVDGVFEADADLRTKQARVVFDSSRTNPDALMAAIEGSGFSAKLKESAHE